MNNETKRLYKKYSHNHIISASLSDFNRKNFVYDNSFLSGKRGCMAPIINHVQLIVVIMEMCSHKAIGSHRSLLTLFNCQSFCNRV